MESALRPFTYRSRERLAAEIRARRQSIWELVQLAADLASTQLPSLILLPDGTLRREPGFVLPEALRELIWMEQVEVSKLEAEYCDLIEYYKRFRDVTDNP